MVREDTIQHDGEGTVTALAYEEVTSLTGAVKEAKRAWYDP